MASCFFAEENKEGDENEEDSYEVFYKMMIEPAMAF